MSWAIAANWLAVLGTLVLTFGTGAQAWANLAEFKSLQASVSEAATDVLAETLGDALRAVIAAPVTDTLEYWSLLARLLVRGLRLRLVQRSIQGAIILMPRRLAQLRDKGGEEAVQMARFIRAAEVWAIFMIGSGLALVGATIQLALAYQ